jgi:serine/threonine protein phosphatase PrpC
VRSRMAGHSSIQGWRSSMEDKYIIEDLTSIPKHSLVAVFDGHAGVECAAFCSNNLVNILQETPAWKLYKVLYSTGNNGKNMHKKPISDADERNKLLSQALVEAYLKLDLEFLRSLVPRDAVEPGYADSQNIDEFAVHVDDAVIDEIQEVMTGGGCTAVCALITPDSVVVANCGDSRCIISSTAPGAAAEEPSAVSASGKRRKTHTSPTSESSYSYTSVTMTDDHKPSNPEERERVHAAGGQVFMDRVDGCLAMSRAIGDFR